MANKPVIGYQVCPYCGGKVPVIWDGNRKETCMYCKKRFQLKRQINDPAGGRNGQADLAMEDLLGHGETRTKEGRELGTEWIMKRFCRIE